MYIAHSKLIELDEPKQIMLPEQSSRKLQRLYKGYLKGLKNRVDKIKEIQGYEPDWQPPTFKEACAMVGVIIK
jgi:hypothetical protein